MDENSNSKPRRFGIQFFATIVLILIAAGAGASAMYLLQIRKPFEENVKENSAMQMQLIANPTDNLADKFTDADHDLLADPPTDPKQFVDPPTLTFCFVADDDPEKIQAEWKPFCDHLSQITGKPVEYLLVKTIDEQLRAMADGKLLICGLNTGAVPQAVNSCGFIPVCRVPTSDPAGTHIEIIVPTSSPIMTLGDLKGHELTLTEPNSNSGYKAPMVLLKDYSLRPERDYVIRMSSSHEASITGIAKGEYQAAAVASDMLERAETNGDISKGQFRSIYRSESFPSAALGYVYNLKPELAAKVKEAMMSFEAKGTPLESIFADGGDGKFIAVNYKNDWALIRRIDEECAALKASK